jgi:hypothetical protein
MDDGEQKLGGPGQDWGKLINYVFRKYGSDLAFFFAAIISILWGAHQNATVGLCYLWFFSKLC